MARAGRFRIGAMEALWAQLQFAPASAAQRMVSRIRSFIVTVGADTVYPPASVVREVVRFPVEQVPGDADAMLVGAALRADLAELHLRLSRRVPATGDEAIGLADAARACGVSVRTLRRWREQGLLLHWIGDSRGRMQVGVLRADLDSFTRSHRAKVERAARFAPTTVRERTSIRSAVQSLSASGLSERRVIAQVARQHGRAAGTVRAMVVPVMERSRAAARRADETRARATRLWRMWGRGVPVGAAARMLGISDRMAQHALRTERLRRLAAVRDTIVHDARGLDPSLVADSEWVGASAGLAVVPLPLSAAQWLSMRMPQGLSRPPGGTLAVVMRALLARAASVSAQACACPARVSAAALDRAETDLRWAARILLTLAIDSMPAIEARVRVWRSSAAGAASEEMPPELAVLAMRAVLEATASEVASLRTGRTRIERLASAQMDLALARTGAATRSRGPGAASAMERAAPWCALAPLHDARAFRLGLADHDAPAGSPRAMAQRRYGWHGGAPQTIEEIASDTHRPHWVVAAAIGRELTARQR